MLGVRKGSNFQSAHEILHFRDDSVRVSLKVEQHFCLFQTIFIITAFRSTYIITDGLSGILFFKGSLLYTQAAVYYRAEEQSSNGFGKPQ